MRSVVTAAGTEKGTIREVVRLLPEAGWPLITAFATINALQMAHPLAVIATTGVLVERAVTDPGVAAVTAPLAILAGLFTVQQVLGPIQGVVRFRATSRIDEGMAVRAMEATARPAGIGLVEDQAVQDLM